MSTRSCATRWASWSSSTATSTTRTSLRHGDGWLAIDPKGVVGEREYDTGALLRNPYPELLDLPHPARTLERRADQLAEALRLDRARIGAWAWVQAELAAAWAVEDGEDPAYWLACAELLA